MILGALSFDYVYNEKTYPVKLHTVTQRDIQNKMEFEAPVMSYNGLWLMTGAVYPQDNITEGAIASVTLNGKQYEGYLYRLEQSFEDVFEATVSVLSNEEISGIANAVVYGTVRRNVMMVPATCIFSDETGNDAVMVELEGYAVRRTVETGRYHTEKERELLSGVFSGERLIISPVLLQTGDRVSE